MAGLVSSQSYAQEAKPAGWIPEENRENAVNTAVKIEQQKIILEVSRNSDTTVKHVIENGKWTDRARIIEILPGSHTNLKVYDEDGDRLQFAFDGDSFEESKHVLLNQKSGCCDLIVEYKLQNFLELTNGIWTKDIKIPHDVVVMIDEDIEMIFVNSRPIDVSDAKGINCVGCYMMLEFYNDKKFNSKELSFKDNKFSIEYLANEEINEIQFVEDGNGIMNFNVMESDQLIILKIPLELFLNPYEVYFTNEDDTSLDQIDKIRKTEFYQDDSHVSISFRTTQEGVVSIVGATQEDHEKKLMQVEKMFERQVESEMIEEKKGVAIPIPGTTAYEEMVGTQDGKEQKDTLSFADDLEKSEIENSQNYTIILAVIGIIAAIIIGIIVKIKKN